jgi:hypothetical protein
MSATQAEVPMEIVDYDVHGVVGIRLRNASRTDVAEVSKQIGPLQTISLDRDPDITINFVRDLPLGGTLTHVNFGQSGFASDSFTLRRGKSASAIIDFRQLGGTCEIICRSGSGPVPLLILIVGITALAKGFVPVHGSAFDQAGSGTMVVGWSKGGKTEALLAFGQRGATYVGDEWILVSPDGSEAFGIPEHIRLWDWHLAQLSGRQKEFGAQKRLFFRSIQLLDWLVSRVPGRFQKCGAYAQLKHAMPALKRQLNVRVPPAEIFGEPTVRCSTPIDRIFFMLSHDSPEINIDPADPIQIAMSMAKSVQYEQLPLTSAYLESQFAFPEVCNPFLESLSERLVALLTTALSGKKAFVVRHPYPVSLAALYRAMAPYTSSATSVRAA